MKTEHGFLEGSQCEWVYNELLKGRHLSSEDAFVVGITRLSAVVWQLRNRFAIPVADETEDYINWAGRKCVYKRYYLENN